MQESSGATECSSFNAPDVDNDQHPDCTHLTDAQVQSIEDLNAILCKICMGNRCFGMIISHARGELEEKENREWGSPLLDQGCTLYVKSYPLASKTISNQNIWDAHLVAFKARAHPSHPFSYSLLCMIPWEIANASRCSQSVWNERVKRGIEPIHNLPGCVIPCYAIYSQLHASALKRNDGATDTSIKSEISKESKDDDEVEVVMKNHSREIQRHHAHKYIQRQKHGSVHCHTANAFKGGKKATVKNVCDESMDAIFDWLCAFNGLDFNEFLLLSHARSSKSKMAMHKQVMVDLLTPQGLTEEQCTSQQWTCYATRSICNLQLSLLRNVPVIGECLSGTLRHDKHVPTFLAICIHIAMNHHVFGLQMYVSQQNMNYLRRELVQRFNTVTACDEFALDAVIARILSDVLVDTGYSSLPPHKIPAFNIKNGRLECQSLSQMCITKKGKLPSSLVNNLRECASIGFNLINTFYERRYWTDHLSHEQRSIYHGLCKQMDHAPPSSVFDEVHASVTSQFRKENASSHKKSPILPPWPLTLIPESRYHRLIVMETLEPAHKWATELLQNTWADNEQWSAIINSSNALNMFHFVLKFGVGTLQLTDSMAHLVSDRMFTVCAGCFQSIHSTQFAIPLGAACCYHCNARLCPKCFQQAFKISTNGFLCSACKVNKNATAI